MSASGIAILKEASRVQVFRVASLADERNTSNTIQDYPILSTGKEHGQAFATRLSAILLGDGVTRNRKKCGIEPGVAFRLWKGDQSVEVLVCFTCNVMWPHVVGEQTEKPWSEWQDFDSARRDLLLLTKEAFPDDPEIESLVSAGNLSSVGKEQSP